MIWFLWLSILSYTIIVIWVWVGVRRLKGSSYSEGTPTTGFTIIVPFRNEENRIGPLLRSIGQLDYPRSLFEVIFVNDDSDDKGETLIRESLDGQGTPINFRILNNIRQSGSPKKDAITLAVKTSTMDWIACTDADCSLPERWLKNLDNQIRHRKSQCIIGGIGIDAKPNFLEQFQLIEQLGLQQFAKAGVGWNDPILSNGANLAYSRQAFTEARGYEGNDHLASGDDQFLVEKLHSINPDGIKYITDGGHLVRTKPEFSWKSLNEQRVRWASKQTRRGSKLSRTIGLLMFAINAIIPLGIVATITPALAWPDWVLFFALKVVLDSLLLALSSASERSRMQPIFVPFVSLLYPLIMLIVAVRSLGGSFNWKQRQYSNQR